ncbi:hypothetical protein Tco_1067378 [Tanacetum coccineum]|uniref:Uncharacterized protein n=1 Tax=Tanacetum coccineum TaxID=301880 RepID=A0ABQ5HE26_9ASTR
MAPLSPRDQRHLWFRYEGHEYTDADRVEGVLELDAARNLQFQLGGLRCGMSWRQFVLAVGLHTAEEIDSVGLRVYWAESTREIANKGDISVYMNVRAVNVPYLLAQYLLRYAFKRKLRIYEWLGDNWAWVAPGPERQQVVAAGVAQAHQEIFKGVSRLIRHPSRPLTAALPVAPMYHTRDVQDRGLREPAPQQPHALTTNLILDLSSFDTLGLIFLSQYGVSWFWDKAYRLPV